MYGGKKYSETVIPSMETSKATFARTEDNKIKKIIKK